MPFLLYILLNNLKEEIHIPYGQIQLTKGYFNSLKKFKAKKKKIHQKDLSSPWLDRWNI